MGIHGRAGSAHQPSLAQIKNTLLFGEGLNAFASPPVRFTTPLGVCDLLGPGLREKTEASGFIFCSINKVCFHHGATVMFTDNIHVIGTLEH